MIVRAVLSLALALSLLPAAAMAQGVPRIKATVIAFDGKILTLDTGDASPMSVGLLPNTKIVKQEKRSVADIKQGDYAGATFITAKDGSKRAQEVHVFPESLRGNGEGIVSVGGNRFMIGGVVSASGPASLSLDYHGAQGGEGAECTGRPRLPITPGVGCQGTANLTVAPGVPVVALVDGDPGLLVPGTILAVSILAGPDGHPVTPGLTVQGMAPPAEEKPSSPSSPKRGR